MKAVSTLLAVLFFSISMATPARAQGNPFRDAGFIPVKDKISAQDFTLEDLEGRPVAVTDFRGKVVLIFFWTTW